MIKVNKYIFSFLVVALTFAVPLINFRNLISEQAKMSGSVPESIYDFKATLAKTGQEISLASYKGNVLLITNVASKCGYADNHYKELQTLHERFYKDGLRILAFPCNQFLNQEPGSAEDVCQLTKKKYNVEFDIFEKVNVNGNDAHPLFKYLKSQQRGLIFDAIKWNFTKFLVDRNGKPVSRQGPDVSPLKMVEQIEQYLNPPVAE